MRILLAGGSGFLGRALQSALRTHGHSVAVLTRTPRPGATDQIAWTPDGTAGAWAQGLEGADAIVNLAGEGIADRRWSNVRKQALRSSRLLSTRSLVAAIGRLSRPPAVLVNASAVGYYGGRGDELITEASPPGSDFLADLCVGVGTRSRTGFCPDAGGARSYRSRAAPRRRRAGIAAPTVSPRRGRTARCQAISSCPGFTAPIGLRSSNGSSTTEAARGAFNGTAPAPVTSAEFARALGRGAASPGDSSRPWVRVAVADRRVCGLAV